MNIFISQPMRGKTDDEITHERSWIEHMACEMTTPLADGEEREFIDSFFEGNFIGNRVAYLGASISLLAEADIAIFADGWEQYDGCCIEHEVAQRYGIKCVYAEPVPVDGGMDAQRESKILEDAVDTFGMEAQAVVAVEELSELQKALCKWLRYQKHGQGDYDQIITSLREEMADVNIMLGQLHFIFGDVTEEETAKLLRLEKLIADATSNER